MGKNHPTMVKKYELGSASVELISEEKFTERTKKDVSSCSDCHKERTRRPDGQKNNGRSKRKQVKSKTPIVICLKEQLDAALRLKNKEKEKMNGVASRKPHTPIESVSQPHSNGLSVPKNPDWRRRKDKKNFHAFLSVIEKVHRKDTTGRNIVGNLDYAESEFHPTLNNVSYQPRHKAPSYTRQSLRHFQRIKEQRGNVQVICNDLSKNFDGKLELDATESETSSISSGSDVTYEWDGSPTFHSEAGSVGSACPDSQNKRLLVTFDELRKLATYATGRPLVRRPYCMGCLYDWASIKYFHTNFEYGSALCDILTRRKYSVGETRTSADPDSGERDSSSISSTTDPDSDSDSSPPLTTNLDELDDYDQDCLDSDQHQCIDHCVYIDLTDTDISFSVYYHENLPNKVTKQSEDFSYANLEYYGPPYYPFPPPASTATTATTSKFMSTNGNGRVPEIDHYFAYPFIFGSYPHSDQFLQCDPLLPKTVMIPPKELQKFNVTQPPPRQWIHLQQPDCSRPTAVFTVMCYNVLCDKYCTRQLYGYCPTWALNWEYRKKGIMEEIKLYNADIISLQEVETDQFYNFFLPELKREGYNGIFSPKSRARTMSEGERKHVDGCAIFFRQAKFCFVKEYLIEFNQLAMANAEGNDDMLNRVMTKDNIGLAALLETKEGAYDSRSSERHCGQPVLVATAHIHWDPEYSDVKLIQTMMLMWELKHIIEEACLSYGQSIPAADSNSIPLLLCGDLNSLPNSGVVEYLSTGKVAADHPDFKEYGYRSSLRKISTAESKDVLAHNFRLGRAYEGDTMPFTNYTYDFKGVIDYIFYSREHMNLLCLLGPLDEEWFRENKVAGCPHPHIPSDHFSLFVELEMFSPIHNGRGCAVNNTAATTNNNNNNNNNLHLKVR